MAPKINYIEPTSVQSNGIQIHYDGFGDWGNPKVLLISGQGAQMISWDEQFCESLANRGYCVIRFDNRDVGLSTKFDELGIPDVTVPFQKWLAGEPIPLIEAPYSLIDMAKDAVGLMDALGIPKAHLMGISMGGLVTQLMGIHFPDRVESLTLMATFAKSGEVISPDPIAARILVQSPAKSFEEGILRGIENAKVFRGSRFPLDELRARRRLEAKRNRMHYPPWKYSPDGSGECHRSLV